MTIDYKALAGRVAQRAIYADNNADPRNKEWAADLRTVVTMLNEAAEARPVAWMALAYGLPSQATTDEPTAIRWRKAGGDVVSLFTYPAPQPIPEGWKLIKDCTREERSWPEDYSQENGNYFLTCNHCGREFTGHKRRVTCKVCAETSIPVPQPHPALTESMRREIARAVDVAVNPPSMSVHDGKARIDASLLQRMLAIIDAPQREPTEAQIEAWQLLADLVAGLEATHWSSWQTTAHFDSALDAARAALAAKEQTK